MTTVQQELASVENTLKKCAEELGELNLSNNQFLESNEELSNEIQRLQNKITKKTHILEQEAKDKQIIHQKLIQAEEVKEQIEIRIEKYRAQREQQEQREELEKERQAHQVKQQQQQLKEQEMKSVFTKGKPEHDKTESKPPIAQTKEPSTKQVTPQVPTSSTLKPSPQTVAPAVPKKESSVAQSSPTPAKNFQNASKGEYEPPALFMQESESSSSSDNEQDNSQVLQKLKLQLKQDKEQLEED